MKKDQTLADYLAAAEYPVIWYTSFGVPCGQTLAHTEDTELGSWWGDLTGSIDSRGRWQWDGFGDPVDFCRNTVTNLIVYSDRACWVSCEIDSCLDAGLEIVALHESSAGNLALWCEREDVGFCGLELVESDPVEDARALAQGDTADWTVDQLSAEPDFAEIAYWTDYTGWLIPDPTKLGRAACDYLGLNNGEV